MLCLKHHFIHVLYYVTTCFNLFWNCSKLTTIIMTLSVIGLWHASYSRIDLWNAITHPLHSQNGWESQSLTGIEILILTFDLEKKQQDNYISNCTSTLQAQYSLFQFLRVSDNPWQEYMYVSFGSTAYISASSSRNKFWPVRYWLAKVWWLFSLYGHGATCAKHSGR